MTIRDSLNFSFNGIESTTMGLSNINTSSSGMLEEPFASSKEINEIKIRGKDKPYFMGTEYGDNLEFDLSFSFDESWNEDKLRQVARWLCVDSYKPLTFENSNKVYYCMPIDDFTLVHNALSQGYIELTMRCNAPYAFSPEYLSPLYDYSSNSVSGTIFEFQNEGDLSIYPEIEITKIGAGDIEIINQTNEGKSFKFVGLEDQEVVYVNCETEQIITDIPGFYRYDNFFGDYLEFVYGVNTLLIKGNFKFQLRYKFKLL